MQWFEVAVHIFITALLCLSFAWTLVPWGFAMSAFRRGNSYKKGLLGFVFWWTFIIGHIVALYLLWASTLAVIWLVIVMLVCHLVYGFTVVRKVNA
ncbi:hypothetical protein D1Z90_16080 [Motilimonas pumila]|uniref:DUF2568 domain-containing protein n=1 Tax=Motilimonas pumila TaxID=2303987 RepID=A0A418YBK2_9GAMM|nr:hypothetical protein D1Z90_16080 [Motilimonas pumila]